MENFEEDYFIVKFVHSSEDHKTNIFKLWLQWSFEEKWHREKMETWGQMTVHVYNKALFTGQVFETFSSWMLYDLQGSKEAIRDAKIGYCDACLRSEIQICDF